MEGRSKNLPCLHPKFEFTTDVESRMSNLEGGSNVLIFKVGSEEKGILGHLAQCFRNLKDCVSEFVEKGVVHVIKQRVLHVHIFDLVLLSCLGWELRRNLMSSR